MKILRICLPAAGLGAIAWLVQWLYIPSSMELAQRDIESRGGLVLVDSERGYARVSVLLQAGLSDDDLRQHTALERLHPFGVRITPYSKLTNEGLKWLTRLDGLQTLNMPHAEISDEGLAYLAALHKLQVLILDSCRITDRGLAYLQKLPQLRMVSLFDTRVSAEGVAKLRAACPRLVVRASGAAGPGEH